MNIKKQNKQQKQGRGRGIDIDPVLLGQELFIYYGLGNNLYNFEVF